MHAKPGPLINWVVIITIRLVDSDYKLAHPHSVKVYFKIKLLFKLVLRQNVILAKLA